MWDAGIYFLTTNKGMGKERARDRLHWRKTWTKTHQHQRLFFFASFSLPHSFPTYCIYFCVCVSFFMQAVWQQAYERKMPHLHKKPFSLCVILGCLFPNFFSFSSCLWICLSLLIPYFINLAELFIHTNSCIILTWLYCISFHNRREINTVKAKWSSCFPWTSRQCFS